MSAYFDDHPWMLVAAIFGAMFGVGVLVLAGEELAARLLPRGKWVPYAAGLAGAFFLASLAASRLRLTDDKTTGWIVAVCGGAGVLLLIASFGQDVDDRADRLGMRVVRGFPNTVFGSEERGVAARLSVGQGGSRPVPDSLQLELDASSLGAVSAAARRATAPMSAMERIANADLSELFSGTGVSWRGLEAATRPESWPGWEIRGAPPALASAILGRAPSPDRWYKGRLTLKEIGLRDGRLRCEFRARWIERGDVSEARDAALLFAAYLRGERPLGPA